MLVWATKVAALSTSLMVRVPAVEMSTAALVSVRLAMSADSTAASLVPLTVTVTSWVSTPPRPSLTCTVNTSS
ncbi:hypothetical protein D3C85_1835010 [compost metagenome]